MKKVIQILRLDHWTKNVFMFPGFLLALSLLNLPVSFHVFLNLLLAILAIGFVSSANYVINEYSDREFDSIHPLKKKRAAVNHQFPGSLIFVVWLCCATTGCFITLTFLNPLMRLCVLALVIFGLAYNLKPVRLKDIPIVDVLWESLNGLVRVCSGWFAVENEKVPPISFLLGFYFLSVFLMSAKRISEYRLFKVQGLLKDLNRYRKSFLFYNEDRLLTQSFISAMMMVFFFSIFSFKWILSWIIFIPGVIIVLADYLRRVLNNPLSITETPHQYFDTKAKMILAIGTLLAMLVMLVNPKDFLAQLLYSYQLNLMKILGF